MCKKYQQCGEKYQVQFIKKALIVSAFLFYFLKSVSYLFFLKLAHNLKESVQTKEKRMFELIFILVFTATLLVTGVTMLTVFAAVAFSIVVMVSAWNVRCST